MAGLQNKELNKNAIKADRITGFEVPGGRLTSELTLLPLEIMMFKIN